MKLKSFVVLASILANVVFIFILASKASDKSINFSEIVEDEKTVQSPQPKVIGEAIDKSAQADNELMRVSKAIDGDTIVLEGGEVVRYIGIDTPEGAKECFAKESTQKNKELVEGKMVRLEKDVSERDRYQRLLLYVYQDETFVNDYLVREGFASAVSYLPDVKYQEQFSEAEREARENNRGLWKECEDFGEKVENGR